MNKYENGVIKHQIQLEAYKNGQANEIISLLDKANSEIAKFVKGTDGVYTKKRYLEIARKLKDVSSALKENVGSNIDLDGLIDYELKKQKSLLDSVKGDIVKAKGGVVNFLYPTREQVKTAALFKPVTEGFTYESYLNGIEAGLYNTWDSAIRTGYLTGQPTKRIVSKVLGGISPETKLKNPGLMNTLRNSIYGNTRTVLQSFAEETRERVYQENEQCFGDGTKDGPKYEYLATLDNRTCIVCGSASEKMYKSLKDAPRVPQHRGCRCLIIPYFNIEGDTRASKDGQIKSDISFSEWLGEQDEKTQRDILGLTRFKMFKDGTKIEQFVDNGQTLTLKQLAEKGLIDMPSKEVMSDKEFESLLLNGRKQWNDGKIDFNFTDEERKDIAFNLHIAESEVDDYVRNARQIVNNYLQAKDTEIVHYDLSKLLNSEEFWKEPRFKSQFETGKSLAYYNTGKRKIREDELLQGSEKMKDEYRPIYATAIKNKKIFEDGRVNYGDVAIVLNKEKVKDRISYTIGDSLNHDTFTAFQKDFGTALSKQNDTVRQLGNFRYLFNNKGELVDKYEYIESQIWGGIDFRKGDVKAIVINKKSIGENSMEKVNLLKERAKKYNVEVIIQEELK